MSNLTRSRKALSFTLLVGALLAPAAGTAASRCNAMQQDACTGAAECVWVDGYTRKDGRSVASHCKTKSTRKSDPQVSSGALKLSKTE